MRRTKAGTTVLITSHMGIINLNNVLHKIWKDFYAVFTDIEVDTGDIPQLLTYAYYSYINIRIPCLKVQQSISKHIGTHMNHLFLILTYPLEIDYFQQKRS